MKETDEEFLLRRYLLGELGEGEREPVEERFITDRAFKELTLVVEDELVEAYHSGELSEVEEASFENHFLATPQQRRKVRLARALKEYATAEATAHPTEPGGEIRAPGPDESKLGHTPFWHNPWVFVPTSLALLLVVVVVGLSWLAWTQQRGKDLAAVRLELERLNRQPAPDGSPWVALTPLNVRGAGETNVLQSPAGGTVVRLWLMLVKDEYQGYQVVLQKDGDAEQFSVSGLRAETTPRGRAIPLRIPAEVLPPGTFILKLSGAGEGERVEEVGEYNFRVTR